MRSQEICRKNKQRKFGFDFPDCTNFCNELKEIKSDKFVAPYYGKIKAQLKADGHPIPENDIWMPMCVSANVNNFLLANGA